MPIGIGQDTSAGMTVGRHVLPLVDAGAHDREMTVFDTMFLLVEEGEDLDGAGIGQLGGPDEPAGGVFRPFHPVEPGVQRIASRPQERRLGQHGRDVHWTVVDRYRAVVAEEDSILDVRGIIDRELRFLTRRRKAPRISRMGTNTKQLKKAWSLPHFLCGDSCDSWATLLKGG